MELAPGDADHPPAGGLEEAVAFAVAFEGLVGGVPGGAVELDDEFVLSPDAVELEPPGVQLERLVALGAGQAGLIKEDEEALLERFAGDASWARVDNGPQVAAPPSGGIPLEEGIEGERVGEALGLGLFDRALELVAVEDGRQVEQGPGDGRDGDSLDDGCFVAGEGRVVDLERRPRPLRPRHGDLDSRAVARPDAPERGRVAVA